MCGRRPGITFGFGGIGGFVVVAVVAAAVAIFGSAGFAVTSVAAAAPRDMCGSAGFAMGLVSGWLKILP